MIRNLFLAGVFSPFLLMAQPGPLFTVDYDSYLSKHDIVYKTPAYEGFEGFPLGNGDLGGMVWNNKNGLEVQINKNDLFDLSTNESETTLRGGARLSIDLGAPGFEWIYLDDFDGRLSLKKAQVNLSAKTPFMQTGVSSWVAADKNVWFFKIKTKELNQLTKGTQIRVSLERFGSRAFPGWYGGFSKNTSLGLGGTVSKRGNRDIILEQTFNGLNFSVVCRILGEATGTELVSTNRVEMRTAAREADHDITVLVSVVTSNESETPTRSAIQLLDNVEKESIAKEEAKHCQWWDSFWKKSFVHLGNDYIENLYYFRRYLMASSSRGRFPVVFNGGLWTWNHDVRNWVTPHHWNTQQQYWGLCAQNDSELLLPYMNTYFSLMPEAEKYANLRGADHAILWSEAHDFMGKMVFWDREDMVNNFTPASQIAGFFWEYYQYTSDKEFLERKAYPFMKKAAEFYLQKLQWDSEKNEYFIYPSQPYESPETNKLLNPTTDRNMIESLFKSCIDAARILKVDKEKVRQWQHVTGHLWPLPIREVPGEGEVLELAYFKDGSIYPKLEKRGNDIYHFSANTSVVFPANLVGLDQKEDRRFKAAVNVVKSHPPTKNAITPDPIVAARLGLPHAVLHFMANGIRRLQHFPQGLFYNIDHWYYLSLYADSLKTPDITGQRDYIYDQRAHYANTAPAKPFVQCGLEPLSIYSTAVNEMLLQSNEGKIRVFPATPDNWPSAFTLLARGAFLVSSRKNLDGSIAGVYIESLKGNECKIVNPWGSRKVTLWSFNNGKRVRISYRIHDSGVIIFKTTKNVPYLLVPEGADDVLPIQYQGAANNSVKVFLEASLGKKRDF